MRFSLLKDNLTEKLPVLVMILFLLQPVLDVAGYWQEHLGISNIMTLSVRMLLLTGSFALGFVMSERKRYYAAAVCIFAAHMLLHAYACAVRPGGYTAPARDLLNLVRIYYLPMMTICLVTFMKKNGEVLTAVRKAFVLVLLTIGLVQALSVLTGTNPYTYPMYFVGVLGWFLWTNSQSAILSMLLPVAVLYMAERRENRLLPLLLVTAAGEASLFFLGPRLAFASLLAGGGLAAASLLVIRRACWKHALAVLLVTIFFAALYRVSPTHERAGFTYMENYYEWERVEQLEIQYSGTVAEILSSDNKAGSGILSVLEGDAGTSDSSLASLTEEILDAENADKLEELYRSKYLLWSVVERFGRDRVFQLYQYTADPEILGNVRKVKISFCRLLMEEAGLTSRLFGLNLQEMTFTREDKDGFLVVDNFDVENDFHGLFFLAGVTGLLLMTAFIAVIALRALFVTIRAPKTYFTLKMASMGIAFALAMGHAVFTASVLRRTNASIYLAAVLAALWYLTDSRSGSLRSSAVRQSLRKADENADSWQPKGAGGL